MTHIELYKGYDIFLFNRTRVKEGIRTSEKILLAKKHNDYYCAIKEKTFTENQDKRSYIESLKKYVDKIS